MARPTQQEQLRRLERRYASLVAPTFIIAESVGAGVRAVIILSTGKKQTQSFARMADFETFLSGISNCNVIVNDSLRAFRTEEIEQAVKQASIDDLRAIVADEATPEIMNRIIVRPIRDRLAELI